jgi:hypothetical protein
VDVAGKGEAAVLEVRIERILRQLSSSIGE